jgi:hypothetical protein
MERGGDLQFDDIDQREFIVDNTMSYTQDNDA